MDFQETGWGVVNWIGLAEHRSKWRALVNAVMNLLISQNMRQGNFLTRRGTVSFSMTLLHRVRSPNSGSRPEQVARSLQWVWNS